MGFPMTAGECADELGLDLNAFRVWAHRRKLKPIRRERVGRSTYAIYDSDDVRHARDGEPPTAPPRSL